MKVAVLGGTGAFGSALAARLVEAGIDVTIGSRDPDRAAATAAEIGSAGATNADAVAGVDLVVLAVEASAALSTTAELADAIGETPVLSVASQIRFENRAALPSDDPVSLAEQAQQLLRGPVVAGLHSLGSPGARGRQGGRAMRSSAATTRAPRRLHSSSRRRSSRAAHSTRARWRAPERSRA